MYPSHSATKVNTTNLIHASNMSAVYDPQCRRARMGAAERSLRSKRMATSNGQPTTSIAPARPLMRDRQIDEPLYANARNATYAHIVQRHLCTECRLGVCGLCITCRTPVVTMECVGHSLSRSASVLRIVRVYMPTDMCHVVDNATHHQQWR